MSDETKRNPHIPDGFAETVINEVLHEVCTDDGATRLNPYVVTASHVQPGNLLLGKYQVQHKLDLSTGEADLYLCTFEDVEYVAKIYRRSDAVKDSVTQQLLQLQSPYVAQLFETGLLDGVTVEILPYYPLGSLKDRTFSYEELKDHIIPCLNEGLHALHLRNIIHKDLKPANIMAVDQELHVAIIDFGISSMTEDDNTVIVTKTGMTPEYSAPETFIGLYSSNADYYSMGITLYELFCGTTPYHMMSVEEIEQYHAIQRIPFPDHMPKPLQELIRALTYYDISNRRDKENPNRRWGYEEVAKWLQGIPQTVPGEGIDRKVIPPFSFLGQDYESKTDLVQALIEHWNDGKKQLFRGKLTEYFAGYDAIAYQICQNAEREASTTSGKDDLIFWKAMLQLSGPEGGFFWRGRRYAGLPAMGRELLEHLDSNDRALDDWAISVLKEEVLSHYVQILEPENSVMLDAVKALEASQKAFGKTPRQRKRNLYLTAYMLSGQRILSHNGESYHSLEELTTHMRQILGDNNQHLDAFKAFCHTLVDTRDRLDPAFEAWLIALGKQDAIDRWKAMLGATEETN